jgi:hypothetical protein
MDVPSGTGWTGMGTTAIGVLEPGISPEGESNADEDGGLIGSSSRSYDKDESVSPALLPSSPGLRELNPVSSSVFEGILSDGSLVSETASAGGALDVT